MSFLSTILSIKPCSNKNSDLWKPSGNFCFIVCSITLGPAKPINALGSAKIISPKLAKLAVTPPVVGSVSTVIFNRPASSNFATAAEVFAICINDTMPSCILAPPDTQKIINGNFSFIASSIASVIFSPTTLPILPIPSKCIGSVSGMFSYVSTNVPSSIICFILLLADILKCLPQFGHTLKLL